MTAEHRFDLVRIDVRAAPDDDVLDPADHVKVAGFVHEPQVTHVRPAVARVRPRDLAPVAALDQVAAHAYLSLYDLPLGAVVWSSNGGPAKALRVGRARHRQLAGVHRAVEARDRDAGRGFPPFGDLRGKGGAGDRDRTQSLQRWEGVVQHADHVGRHADHHRGARFSSDGEADLGWPMRLAQHDQRGAAAQAEEAHAADALGERRHWQDAVLLGDLQPLGEALEGDLLEPG